MFKKEIIITVLLVISVVSLFSQNFIVKKGQKIQVKSTSYANTLPNTVKKWNKLKPEQRKEHVNELNKSIESGSVAPYTTLTAKFEIVDVNNSSPISYCTVKAIDGTYEYQTTNYCSNDTMHLVRNADIVYSINGNDTIGMAVQGVQRIPNKLKVGDILPSYNDYMITIPETWTRTHKEAVKSFSYTTSKNKIGWMQDSYSGEFSYGEFKVSERHDIYKTINHKLKITQQIKNLTVNYFIASVTAKKQITIGGEIYESFIIESESWSKGGLVTNYEGESNRIVQEQLLKAEKVKNRLSEINKESGFTNDQGYVVSYKKEWFVPGYGIVKTEIHDGFGAIQTYMTVEF